jgi:diaminopimelate decarboxylase
LAEALPRALLPDTAEANERGHLSIGGCDLTVLAEDFGTPLYVYDEATVLARALQYQATLNEAYPGQALVCYAAKAYCAPWLLRRLAPLGVGLDVVSGGELYTAGVAGFPSERTYFHGNNKSPDELAMALDRGVARIVVDNLEEIERLNALCAERGVVQQVLLRVAPGVEAHTHEHIKTGVLDTKFGLSIDTGAAEAGVSAIQAAKGLDIVGLHAHIGSQIFELGPYEATVVRVFEFARRVGMELREFSPGGGFGVRYTLDDETLPLRAVVQAIASAVCRASSGQVLPKLTIEPGRSIVGPAAVALYRVGSVKEIRGVRTYVAVDGGMADNIRPTAYGARYAPLLANRVLDAADAEVAIAGRYCESGDILMKDAHLPYPAVGDLVAVPGAGAYHMSMASNYNMVPRPAVVVVKDGQARLVRRRETYSDLLIAETW